MLVGSVLAIGLRTTSVSSLVSHLYNEPGSTYDATWRELIRPRLDRRSIKLIRRSTKVRRNMAAKMTQAQLVKELAEAAGTSGKIAKAFLEKYAVIAVRETRKSGVFVLPGIGRLVRVDRKARMGRNPATGEAIKIPAKKVVKFRVAKAVKDTIVPPKKK
jgi:DNA-binding protein HU-beta